MRSITKHLGGVSLNVAVGADEPDMSGASHLYEGTMDGNPCIRVQFQKGPRADPASIPGASDEALIAIVIDRLEGFQAGPFRCRENDLALTKMEEALHWIQSRARERHARGVLGKNIK